MDRRGFLKAIFAAGAAPAFIKADNLMKLVIPSQELFVKKEIITSGGNILISSEMIAKEALKILEQNLSMTREINRDFDAAWNNQRSTINVKMPRRYYS